MTQPGASSALMVCWLCVVQARQRWCRSCLSRPSFSSSTNSAPISSAGALFAVFLVILLEIYGCLPWLLPLFLVEACVGPDSASLWWLCSSSSWDSLSYAATWWLTAEHR